MDHFVDDAGRIVSDALDGLIRGSEGRLARLDGYPHIKVVLRTDHDPTRVAVISGGGSGHEPSHAGFVGRGMLTAAVCGEVFASPSVEAVLAAILATTGEGGCLLIVKSYTGDRLNFGLAAERARALGRQVEMIVVSDDIALPDVPQPRGIAGTVLVHKIAGAAAEGGADLEEVAARARSVASRVRSLGYALDVGTVPGSPTDDRVPSGSAEIGLGIHGEPGAGLLDHRGASAAIEAVIERVLPAPDERRWVTLLNDLGGSTPLEMSILAGELLRRGGDRIEWLIGPAPVMTSLDMHGFSVSVLPATSEEVAALRLDVGVTAWPGCRGTAEVTTLPVPAEMAPVRPAPSDDPHVRELLQQVCTTVIEARAELNELDGHSGDGDTGSTLASAAEALQERLDTLPLADEPALLQALSDELSRSMGGSAGVLLAILLAAAGEAAADGASVREALQAGLRRVQDVGGARVGDRTMLDAFVPALEALPDGWPAAADAARRGATATAAMGEAGAGRSQYVGAAHLEGHADPGAEAVARVFERLASA